MDTKYTIKRFEDEYYNKLGLLPKKYCFVIKKIETAEIHMLPQGLRRLYKYYKSINIYIT